VRPWPPPGSPEPAADHWRTRLRNARLYFTATRQDRLLEVVDHALQLAESGAGSDIVNLLASGVTTDDR
jgi:hypothetical protein